MTAGEVQLTINTPDQTEIIVILKFLFQSVCIPNLLFYLKNTQLWFNRFMTAGKFQLEPSTPKFPINCNNIFDTLKL